MIRAFPGQLSTFRSWSWLACVLMLAMAGMEGSAQARPVVCTTTLEAAVESVDTGSVDFDSAAVDSAAFDPAVFDSAAFDSAAVDSTAFDSTAVAPDEVTRCAAVETTEAMLERRAYTWTAPYARGVDVIHQFTDLLGISMAGPQGNRLMGFGFPDQTIVWDGLAVQNTYLTLMEQQSPLIPLRTKDLANGFNSSIADQVSPPQVLQPLISQPLVRDPQMPFTPVRGLW